MREKVVCHQHKGGDRYRPNATDEIRVLTEVVYIMSKGPRTEP